MLCWGCNTYGQATVPSDVANAAWAAVSAGYGGISCGILAASRKLRCWGTSTIGISNQVPADVVNAAWSAVSVGSMHICGLLAMPAGNTLRCWGDNSAGESTAPNDVTYWASISVGNGYTAGIPAGGSPLRCWGGTAGAPCSVPADYVNAQWTAISASIWSHACGILASGSLKCWGGSIFTYYWTSITQTSSLPYVSIPQEVSNPATKWNVVAAGNSHNCGIVNDGRLLCWGGNYYKESSVPTDVSSWTAGSASVTHTCGIVTGSNIMRCWGDNGNGQLNVPTVS